ncbi:hypothetical protein B4U79_08369, partial [Dinothrombium tinctorium]
MIKMNLIQESTSEWASPILIVLKEDPNEPTKIKRRFVTDFRELNAHTVKDPYPMPLIADIMLCFASAKYFTALDLKSGFWQISLRSTDRMKTAFVTLDGLYEYVVMAMGLTNSPATFSRLMDKILGDLKWKELILYLDNIVVMSKDFEKHLATLNEVFTRFRKANLTLRPSKCSFATNRVEVLGFIVDENGRKANPKSVEKLRRFPVPDCLK